MLEVRDLVVQYGQAVALDGVRLEVQPGELVTLVGPNGAGKTTLVKTLAGVLRPVRGTVQIHGRAGFVPEGRQLFSELSVEDNLLLGAWRVRSHRPPLDLVYEIFPQLRSMAHRRAGTLSGGQQQMVAVGRALMGDPQLLVVDELSLGLAPVVVKEIVQQITRIREKTNLALLLIEQNVRLAFAWCERAYVIEGGRIVAEGATKALAEQPAIYEAFLGGRGGAAQ
ncbi:MAG: ABC transporter ATP-binding protein [Firmicutes bacterium]|nr:ABC transporter ATP-binding protein [Alicyclobacillaceae bacterium]MCL6496228.1 ABC transporter ATP-binding protein [Bacillota bacterium]